jgi:hypothetical protein
MLLGRPGGPGKIETVNDVSCAIVNFWRAVKADPWSVAEWCDEPVSECDMHAMHIWLVNRLMELREQIRTDIDFYDAQAAGRWVNGQCSWIGSGWCVEPGTPGTAKRGHPRPNLNSGQGVHSGHPRERNLEAAQRPHLSSEMGVHRLPQKIPMIAVKADGACAGRGVHSEAAVRSYGVPSIGNDRGIHGVSVRTTTPGTFLHAVGELTVPDAPESFQWFLALMLRLRHVRLLCGDFRRVLTDSVLGKGTNVGGRRPCAIFLDLPYQHDLRDPYIYNHDEPDVYVAGRNWAIEHGDDADLRIAFCGYEDGFEWPVGWTTHKWTGARGYAGKKNKNREQERIWFSPFCLPLEPKAQPTLW